MHNFIDLNIIHSIKQNFATAERTCSTLFLKIHYFFYLIQIFFVWGFLWNDWSNHRLPVQTSRCFCRYSIVIIWLWTSIKIQVHCQASNAPFFHFFSYGLQIFVIFFKLFFFSVKLEEILYLYNYFKKNITVNLPFYMILYLNLPIYILCSVETNFNRFWNVELKEFQIVISSICRF